MSLQPRSFLFVPGSKPELFAKALASGADAVIVDLEDAVCTDDKEFARRSVAEWLTSSRQVLVRINGRDTPWFAEDAQLGKLRGVAGLVLPKAESTSQIVDLISAIKRKLPVYPLVESAAGMWNVAELAKAPCVRQLMFGTLDFMADTGIESDGEVLNTFRAQLKMASIMAGILPPIDGVTPDIYDTERLLSDTKNSKLWGFAGKLCIHPNQARTINDLFTPSEWEVAWARRVVEASATAKGAPISLDGKMVDRPVLLRAQRIVERAGV